MMKLLNKIDYHKLKRLLHYVRINQTYKNIQNSTQKRGFTLIELMVAISIIAVLSAIGVVSYSTAQKGARDSKRKQDLRAIATALELYYNDNRRYPCTTDWQTSSNTPSFWINDTCSPKINFDNKYINDMPNDPLRNTGNLPKSDNQYGYAYFARGDGGSCNPNPGRQYALITQLENPNDPVSLGKKDIKWCDGKYLRADYDYGSRTFVITSW